MLLKEVSTLELHLSEFKPQRYVPRPSAAMRARVANEGVGQPITVRQSPGGFEILSNPAVWVAAGMSQISTVPVTILQRSDDQARQMVLLNYLDESKLNSIDEAEVYESLVGTNKRGSVSQLAKELGIRRSVVSHSLRLLNLDPSVQESIRAGELSAGHGRALLRLSRPKQCAIAKVAINKRMSVRALEALVKNDSSLEMPSSAPESKDADELRFENELTDWIGSKVTLNDGQLVIDYSNDIDVLSGILEKIGFDFS